MSYPVMSTSVPWSLVKSGFKKTPNYNSQVAACVAGQRSSISLKPFGTWDFTVDLNLVQGGEACQYSVLQAFLGCFMACAGRASFFLFTDPNDNTVDDTGLDTPQSVMIAAPDGALQQSQVTGNGTITQFQLARRVEQGIDILQQVQVAAVFDNGVVVDPAGYTVTNGVVTFTTAPANGHTLAWAGTFQYLCQFTDDTLKDLGRVNKNTTGWLWSCGSVAFEGVFV